jgi:hypothetical protein
MAARHAMNEWRHPDRSRFIPRRHPDRSRFSGEGRDLPQIASTVFSVAFNLQPPEALQ